MPDKPSGDGGLTRLIEGSFSDQEQRHGKRWEAMIACGFGMAFWPGLNVARQLSAGSGWSPPLGVFLGIGIFFFFCALIIWFTEVRNLFKAFLFGLTISSFLNLAASPPSARAQTAQNNSQLNNLRIFTPIPFRLNTDLRIADFNFRVGERSGTITPGPEPILINITSERQLSIRNGDVTRISSINNSYACIISHGRPSSRNIISQITGNVDSFEITFMEILWPSRAEYCFIWSIAAGLFAPGQLSFAYPAGEEIARQLLSADSNQRRIWASFFVQISQQDVIYRLIDSQNRDGLFNIFTIFRNINASNEDYQPEICRRVSFYLLDNKVKSFMGNRTRNELTRFSLQNGCF